MAKWESKEVKPLRGKQVILDISGDDYATLEDIINAKDSIFKTVESYLLFMVKNRVTKARGQ